MAVIQRQPNQLPHLISCDFTPLAGPAELSQTLHRMLTPFENISVATSMQPGEFSLQMLEAPQVAAEELQAAVRWKIKEVLDFDVEDAVIDVFEIPGQKERGRAPMVYVVAAQQDKVHQYVEPLQRAEAALEYIDIPELVQRNIAALLPEDEKGVALLHFGADEGLITLNRNNTLYLARGLDVGYRALLPQQPLSSSADESGLTLEEGIPPAQQRAFDDVILEVQRSLDYYESHFALPSITHLVIAPIPGEVPGMLSYFAAGLGLQVRMLDMNALLEVDTPLSNELQAQCYSAIGAALRLTEAA